MSEMTATLYRWPIGNCQVSALIERAGRFVWGCVPRVDGDPLFSSLLDDNPPGGEGATGFWEIDLEGCVETTQYYLRNTPILVTRHAELLAHLRIVHRAGERRFRNPGSIGRDEQIGARMIDAVLDRRPTQRLANL